MKLVALSAVLIVLPLVLVSGVETDVEDLGVLTPRNAIHLEKGTDRKDWHHFEIELLHKSTGATNLIVTNKAQITLQDMSMPLGRVVFSVRSVDENGMSSDPSFYQFEIQTNSLPTPKAVKETILRGPDAQTMPIVDLLKARASGSVPVPVMPRISSGMLVGHSLTNVPLPTNSMIEFYNRKGRRNEQ